MLGRVLHFLNRVEIDLVLKIIVIFIVALGILSTAIHFIGVQNMKLTIDVENTVTKRDDRKHLDPFEPTNRLVLVGAKQEDNTYHLFDEKNDFAGLQELLDQATILIGHNIAYDLVWLWECGFKYDGPVFDTMLAEYVLQRGIKEPLSLEACAERNKLDTKKQDTLKEYFKKGLNVDEILGKVLESQKYEKYKV